MSQPSLVQSFVPGDDLGVVVGPQVLGSGVQVGGQRWARLDGVAAVDGVEVGVVFVAAGAVAGWLGEGWGGDLAGHASVFHDRDGVAHLAVGEVVAGAVGRGQVGSDALCCWPIAVLAAAFGVELESAAGAAPEGLAQVITGPVGHSALGLVQERG